MKMLMREILPGRRTIRSRVLRRFFRRFFFIRSRKAANAVHMGVDYGSGGFNYVCF